VPVTAIGRMLKPDEDAKLLHKIEPYPEEVAGSVGEAAHRRTGASLVFLKETWVGFPGGA
jgi:hypothetical protein